MTVKLCEKPSAKAENAAGLFTLGEAACAVGAQCGIPRRSIVVDRVVTDSRGDCSGALFVALKGDRFDGLDYVCEAFAKGACAALVSEIPPNAHPEWPLLVVDETLSALADLAAHYRRRLSIPVIGVTGSCGKTTVKEFLAAALSGRYRVAKARASYNNVIGVSLTILSARRDDEVLILELGTNAPGEIEALCEIGRPDIGVITNIGHTHLEKLGSVEGVKKEKGSLMRFLGEGGVLVTNIDCPECKELAGEFEGRAVTVAVEAQAAHKVEPTCEDERGLVFKYDGVTASIPALGRHNALNAGLAAAAAEILGVHSEEALERMAATNLPGMRMERELSGGVLIINDAYNSNFESLMAALDTLHRSSAPGRKILVCGDMLELGKAAKALHRAAGWHIGQSSVGVLVTVGANALLIAQEAHAGGTKVIFHRDTVADVGELLEKIVRPGDVVLFKASRAVHLEGAVKELRRAVAQPPVREAVVNSEPVGARS